MKTILTTLVIMCTVFVWQACDTKQVIVANSKGINKPFPEIKTKVEKLEFNAAIGGTFKLASGSSLKIPAFAFVDKKGEPITDSVKIEFEEYHDATEILLSGITMKYNLNGEEKPFESAGMFKIDGKCKNEEIEVAKGKFLNIDIVSKEKENNYDFFQLDKQSGQWKQIGKAPINESLQVAQVEKPKEIIEKLPEIPDLPDPSEPVLDLELDYSKYTQLKDFYGLAWQVSRKEKINQDEITNTEWTSVVLENTGEGLKGFQLNLKRQDVSKTVKINPVLSKERRAVLEEKYLKEKARMEKELKETEEKRKRDLEKQNENMDLYSKVSRSLVINGFGIYNCDRVISMINPFALKAKFKIAGEQIEGNLYVISNNNSALVYNSNALIRIDAGRKNRIIFITNDKSIAYADSKTMAEVCENSYLNRTDSNINIELKKSDLKFDSAEDLKTLLKQI